MTDSIFAAVTSLREQIQTKVDAIKSDPAMAEILKLQKALNALEVLLGRSATSLSQVFALEEGDGGGSPSVAPDEFVHVPALDAAKRYLKKAGKPARPFAEIVAAIKAGGAVVTAEDRLRIQLVRSTSEVKKVGDDLFGLLDWYPARKGRPPGSKGRAVDADDEPENPAEETESSGGDDAIEEPEGGEPI